MTTEYPDTWPLAACTTIDLLDEETARLRAELAEAKALLTANEIQECDEIKTMRAQAVALREALVNCHMLASRNRNEEWAQHIMRWCKEIDIRPRPLRQALASQPAPSDWAHLKQYGYAPGFYMSKCHHCGAMPLGLDKRATCCRDCAEKLYAASQPAPPAQEAPTREADVCVWTMKLQNVYLRPCDGRLWSSRFFEGSACSGCGRRVVVAGEAG